MYKDFIGWAKEPDKMETKYIIESIRDPKIWDKFLWTEDIDLYERREYDNIADALGFYLTWYISENCYDIRMWQQIYIDGKEIFEELFEPKSITKFTMREMINREITKDLYEFKRENEQLKKENGLMSGFIKAMGERVQDMYKEYCNRKGVD